MHHGQPVKHANLLLQSGALCRSRSMATSAATKPLLKANHANKWTPPQKRPALTTDPSRDTENTQKWLGNSADQSTLAPYKPNPNKWARPVQDTTRNNNRNSSSEGLDTLLRPNNGTNLTSRQTNQLRQRRGTSQPTQWIPQFPSRKQIPPSIQSTPGKVLDRQAAPHLAKESPDNSSALRVRMPSARQKEQANTTNTRPRSSIDNTSRLAKDRIQNQNTEGYSDSADEVTEDSIGRDTMLDHGANERSRRSRDKFKKHGSVTQSLALRRNERASSHSRVSESHTETTKTTKKKAKQAKVVHLDLYIPSIVTVGNLARLLNVRMESLQKCMVRNGMEDQSSYDYILSSDDASLLAMEFKRNPIVDDEAAYDIYAPRPNPSHESMPRRPPVVTIMGHVDHGKTTLLDNLRSSSIAQSEAGGITQHIGAFSVPVPSSSQTPDLISTITFLDTPGHAAFSGMRARGAQVTDIIVLVVAADDGVMPQTREVIELIKKDKGKVGVVVAINKVDKPGVDISKVHSDLWSEGIELEAMGGDVPSVEVSGLTGHGLNELVDTISAVAEIQDVRAELHGPAYGFVLESKVQKGIGNTATVLVLRGCLEPSSYIICGTTFAKVRQLTDANGKVVTSALPSTAVIVSGWKELPHAGDEVIQGKEDEIKKAVENRLRKASLEATLADANAINTARQLERSEREKKRTDDTLDSDPALSQNQEEPRELRIVVKCDVSGSVEAVSSALESIGNNNAKTKIISAGVGEVAESDVMLAGTAEGIVVAFSVKTSRMVEQIASQHGVPIVSSNIIYRLLDNVKARVIKLLPPTTEIRVTGEANVLQLFDIQGKGKSTMKVAGCRVSNGIVEKNKRSRVVRDGQTIHDGAIETLRILKRDVTEVKKGLECGMSFQKFDDLRPGDLLQFYQEIELPGQL